MKSVFNFNELTSEEVLDAVKDLFDEIHFCQEHKMDMEVAALRYKYKAFEQLRYIIYRNIIYYEI